MPRRRDGIHPLHFAGLVALAGIAIGSALLRAPGGEWTAADKREHYVAGRWMGATVFLAAYVSILVRVAVLPGRTAVRVALWLPGLFALALLAALLVAFVAGVVKEGVDAQTEGDVEAADVDATLAGAAAILPAVAFLMVVTPILVPIPLLARLPELLRSDFRRGALAPLAEYAELRTAEEDRERGPDVLLVEDDLVCATVAMRFCARRSLGCRHVETFGAADEVLARWSDRIRLVLLDLFVRVEGDGPPDTGGDWLARLETRFPRSRRPFRVVVLSGHVRFLGPAASLADLVLEKPWDPADLARFLDAHAIGGRR